MSAAALAVVVVVVFLLALYLLNRYGDLRRQQRLVLLGTLMSWYFCFLIVFILPLDVSTTIYRQCVVDNSNHSTPVSGAARAKQTEGSVLKACEEPWTIPDGVLPVFWRVVHWSSQFLTCVQAATAFHAVICTVGIVLQSWKDKIALFENVIYYGTYLLIFVSLLIYVAAHPQWKLTWTELQTIGITAANTWGLFLLVLLLGYGLVEIPRAYWLSSSYSYLLAKMYFKIAKMAAEKAAAEENLADVMEGTRGWIRAGYTKLKDNESSSVTEIEKSMKFTRRDGDLEEQQTVLLRDSSSDEGSPNRRSTGGRYMALTLSQMGIFDDV